MSARGTLVNHLDPLLSIMVSFPSLLLSGGWWKNFYVALSEGATNSLNVARSKGAPNQARSGPGRSAQAGRPRHIPAQFGPGFLPNCFSRDSLFVCTCMWAFHVVSFTVKAWILAIQASLLFGWALEDLHVDASVLGSFGVMFIASHVYRASWSSFKVLNELILKVSSLVYISNVNNKF
jgi:hypothetical protein